MLSRVIIVTLSCIYSLFLLKQKKGLIFTLTLHAPLLNICGINQEFTTHHGAAPSRDQKYCCRLMEAADELTG
jgi:hypothetical protein